MRETSFIDQNKEKWQEFERSLVRKEKDPEKLSDLFTQITDDLSYSRTFYPNRSVRVYLNNLAQRTFNSIYRTKLGKLSYIGFFIKEDLPKVMYENRRSFLLSFFVFALAMSIGMVSSANDSEFIRLILGDQYVEMTQANIEEGDPMAVYKDEDALYMFLRITWNNLMVSFYTFVLGLFFSVGSIYILIRNGIMIGAFHYFFIERSLFAESFLTVWMHGTIEISCIVLAGGAGILMGKGLVFPGTYTRAQAFMLTAKKGVKVMLALIPLIVTAGFIESFLTRYTEVPDFVRLLHILVSFALILGYFVYYPWRKAKSGFSPELRDEKLPPTREHNIEFDQIRRVGEIFTDTFSLLRRNGKLMIRTALLMGTIFSAVLALTYLNDFNTAYQFSGSWAASIWSGIWRFFQDLFQFHNFYQYPLLVFPVAITYLMAALLPTYFIKKQQALNRDETPPGLLAFVRKHAAKLLLPLGAVMLMLFINMPFSALLVALLLPLMLLWMNVVVLHDVSVWRSLGTTFKLLKGSWGTLLVTYLVFVLLTLCFMLLLAAPLFGLYFQVINEVLMLEGEALENFFLIVYAGITFIAVSLLSMAYTTGFSLVYYNTIEINEAHSLKENVMTIGTKRRAYGMETE